MRVTTDAVPRVAPAPPPGGRAAFLIAAALLGVAALDYELASAPVQHLYYLPIIWAAIRFQRRGGLLAAAAAAGLYHLANPGLLQLGHQLGDVLEIALFLAVALVTTRLAEDAERMRLLAHTDDLTGLHNLRSFEAALEGMLAGSGPLSLLVLDVDRLKALNDAHGHLAGAEAVRAVGQVIAREVPPPAVACRYGGDEFVIALPGHDTEAAAAVAESIRRAVQACAPTLAGRRFPAGALTISAGVASAELGGPGAGAGRGQELFHEADRALYRAKDGGRNRVDAAGPAHFSSGSSSPNLSAMR
ncbi:MAG TPA: GGDEF domain-containing protein [Vicinamibacteria bacterium]